MIRRRTAAIGAALLMLVAILVAAGCGGDDTGDGACETILVEEFNIVVPGFSGWRAAMWTSLVVLLAALAVHFMLPYRPYRD